MRCFRMPVLENSPAVLTAYLHDRFPEMSGRDIRPAMLVLPGGGCALPGLQDPLTGSHSVGPRKRSAAGHKQT